MDYEKLHKDTITKLHQMVNSGKITVETACGICADFVPESEDEKIRKSLLAYIKGDSKKLDTTKWIAWLEKQGEHANFRNKIQIGDKVTRNEDGVLVNLSQLNRVAKKQGEQKPVENKGMNLDEEEMTPFQKKVFCIIDTTIEEEQGLKQVCDELLRLAHDEIKLKSAAWSEEDETNFRRTEYAVMKFFGGDCSLVGWLRKSLKGRFTWKPSDEQMKALANALSLAKNCGEESAFDLRTLHEQLKKLRGE